MDITNRNQIIDMAVNNAIGHTLGEIEDIVTPIVKTSVKSHFKTLGDTIKKELNNRNGVNTNDKQSKFNR